MNALDFLNDNGDKSQTKLTAAIHEAVKFDGVDIDTTGDKPYIDFNVSKDGLVQNKRTWLSKPADDAEDWMKDNYKRSFVDLTTWLSCVATEAEMKQIQVPDDLSVYANNLAPLFNSRKGTLLNVKLVPNKEGKFSEFSRYGFVQKHIPGQVPTLKYSDYELGRFQIAKDTATDNPVVSTPKGPLY